MKTQESQFGYVLDGKVYLKGFLDKSDREIGEVVDGEETSIKYFEERFTKVQEKVDELITVVDTAENKGSFLMKIIHLQESLATYNALGDFAALYKSLDTLEQNLRVQILANHERNLLQKRTLLLELKTALETPYLQESVELVKGIQQRWVKTGKTPKDLDENIDTEFKELTNQFFETYKEHVDVKKQVAEQRVILYQEFLKKVQELADKADYEHDVDNFKQLQKEWKELGFLPKNILTPFWEQFKAIGDSFFQGHKEFLKNRKKTSFKKSTSDKIAQKEALLQEAKTLYDLPIAQAVELSKKLQKDWKLTGYLPNTEHLQEEFYLASDYVFEFQYLLNLAHSKDRSFDTRDANEQNQRLIRSLRSLIDRDQDELNRYQENMSSIVIRSSADSIFDKVVDARLGSLERKLKAKKLILQKLKV